VRVHVADTLRDLIGLQGSPRAWTLRAAMQRIAEAGQGVVVVLRQEDSARELTDTLRSFAAAAAGSEASRTGAGEGAVLRTFGVGAQILKDLGVRRMRVLSAPKQMHGISAFGLEVEAYVGAEG
jgi:3,4-dihydroxy 2-butanone 4-phosphate synthase/GTP cyclohydrolase II